MVNELVCIRPDHGCVCREWTLADVDLGEEMTVLAERQSDVEVYCALVAQWNARVLTSPEEASLEFTDFCKFLLNAYDELNDASRTASSGGGSA